MHLTVAGVFRRLLSAGKQAGFLEMHSHLRRNTGPTAQKGPGKTESRWSRVVRSIRMLATKVDGL